MNSKKTAIASTLRGVFWGVLACLATTVYGAPTAQQDDSIDIASRIAADELRVIAGQITATALQSDEGQKSTFDDLAGLATRFDEQKVEVDPARLAQELSLVDVAWQPVKRAIQTLVDTGPAVVFVKGLADKYEHDLSSMQAELLSVADIVRDQKYGSATSSAAQRSLWLNERINRNINSILAGDASSDKAAEELRADTAELLRNIEALTRGDAQQEIMKITDPKAIEIMSSAFRKFSTISTSVDRIAGSSDQLREAAAARDLIVSSGPALEKALGSLKATVDKMGVSTGDQGGILTSVLFAALLLVLALVIFQYYGQKRSAGALKKATANINDGLRKIARGDLTVRVAEDNGPAADIARQINASTEHQLELIQAIRAPFDQSVDEINKMGISARGLVERGKELTRSVGESITAATEMVRTSEEIKTSTAEASRTSDRNCQQVAQGYELTKDMSKASVNVRESVQETSKSAKRQGELIQSVTAAAEYIQALNTKISVVAINTRIEAEKAGEYGRPFLGIAEAIADLLREAGEEGRKIISEVRMLQNMSAENLASMENTVGTVVTILEYIERLDSSLEEINSGSAAISSIIRSVDDAAGQSAVSALHMNSSMAQIRERNLDIGKFSESTQLGVARLQRTMRDASDCLGQFKADGRAKAAEAPVAELNGLEPIGVAPRVYKEEDMSALETAARARASV